MRHLLPSAVAILLLGTLGLLGVAEDRSTPAKGLLGHWKLAGDAQDASGNNRHATNHGVDWAKARADDAANPAGQFNGRGAYLEVPARSVPRLGTGDFTVAAWVQVDPAGDDLPGDVLSLYDPAARRGFNLGIHTAHVTTSQANSRNVYFGIDNGQLESKWTDHGRPGKSVYGMALAVHDGHMYVGTCEPGDGESGHVYRFDGGQKWHDCGSPDPCNAVSALASFDGKLYAGVSRYRVAGSALPESKNPNGGGKVYRYDGDGKWFDCGKLGESDAIGGLAVFKNKLYATSLYKPAGVFRYEGGQKWESCGVGPGNTRVVALAVFNGHLYGTSYDGGLIQRYEGGTEWSLAGRVPETTQTYGFASHEGKLHVTTWPKAFVYRRDGESWTNTGRTGGELESMGIVTYNGKLYTGTLPLAEVYRYDGDDRWTSTGRLDPTPDVKYRRAWTLAVHQGRLFCGTLPSGRVYSIEAGRCVTHDHALPPGWHHLAGVRAGGELQLYVDGKPVARSPAFPGGDFDLSVDRPLRIGTGPQDSFDGRIHDVRLYGRALAPDEIAALTRR